ncbi:MAG: ABC transporter substrate-binding protein [Candidatus Symbiothrix sp.]|jgi:iron complex transport system substrate-binding protein|nr:ABC transporter substrate-binding protein [Candidatus Symbiothrix sp.]
MKKIAFLSARPFSRLLVCSIACSLLFAACRKQEGTAGQIRTGYPGDSVRYAGGFRIETHDDYTLATVTDPWNPGKVLQQYVLVPEAAALPASLPEGVVIRTPLKRIVSYGSVQCSFLEELNVLSALVGVCEPHYIRIPFVQEGVRKGSIANLGQAANPDVEKIMLIEPEALFTAPIEGFTYGPAARSGFPFIECTDYMESSPLGRAEWIRFFALFFDKNALADSLFRETERNYLHLRELTAKVSHRPSVLAETVYNGIWYVPGGKSYIAHLFRDAGAGYLWNEDGTSGSLGLSFETVLEKAENAAYWLIKYNSPNDLTYEELLKSNSNYAFFDACRERRIYACNTGKVPYYEELPIHPDYVLRDMIRIFHPELLPDCQPVYYWPLK